jgi:hypothetical protein
VGTAHGASPISRDTTAEGLAYASEHAEGVLPEELMRYRFELAASNFGVCHPRVAGLGYQFGGVELVAAYLD